jgi:hypothetical protein
MTFTVMLAAKTKGGQSTAWNSYPSPHANPADSLTSGNGLPYSVVATQVGHTP